MKKTIIFLILAASLSSTASFAAVAGSWGLSSNVVVSSYGNYWAILNASYGDTNTGTYTGFFYHFTKDLSIDLGFMLKDINMENRTKDYFNSVYSRISYNLGEGRVVPRVGFEHIRSLIRSGGTDSTVTTQSLILGCEIMVIDNLSIMMDLKVVSNISVEMRRYYEYATAMNMQPVLSMRWYL